MAPTMGYGTLEPLRISKRGRSDGLKVAIRGGIACVVTLSCLACLMIFNWSSFLPTELESKSPFARLVSKLGDDKVSDRLMKENRQVAQLSAQFQVAQNELARVKSNPTQLQAVNKKLKDIGSRLSKSKEALEMSAAEIDSPPPPSGEPPQEDGEGAKSHQLGFISGDRFGYHHVYRDGGYGPRAFDSDEGYYDFHPIDSYLGHHHAVHYRDDRDVLSDGYGDHYGNHYDKQPSDRYGDFFHGRTDGYDWFHPEYPHEDIGPGEFAWSMDHNPIIGDEGYNRYRPNFYMDWDGSGRNLDETKTMGDEDFLDDTADAGLKALGAARQGQQLRLLAGATAGQQATMAQLQRQVAAAKARLNPAQARMSALTLRQDRNGETAGTDLA